MPIKHTAYQQSCLLEDLQTALQAFQYHLQLLSFSASSKSSPQPFAGSFNPKTFALISVILVSLLCYNFSEIKID